MQPAQEEQEEEAPRRVRKARPQRSSFLQGLARLWNDNGHEGETIDSDTSDTVPERQISPPSFEHYTRSTPTNHGQRSAGREVRRPKKDMSALDELDAFNDRLRVRNEQMLRHFKIGKPEAGLRKDKSLGDLSSTTSSCTSFWDSDVDDSLRLSERPEDELLSDWQLPVRSATEGAPLESESRSSPRLSAEDRFNKGVFVPACRSRKLPVCELPHFDLPSFSSKDPSTASAESSLQSMASSSTDPDPMLNQGPSCRSITRDALV